MAIASSINLDKVSSGIKSLNTGMGQLKKSADTVKTVTLNRTTIKKESIARNRMLSTMREESVRRKDQESVIEASGIGGAFKRAGSVIADSTKGFLGRLLDFASSLLLGWLLYNLPTIMTAIEDLIIRIRSLYGILTEFMTNIKYTFQSFGQLLSAVYQDIIHFDFTDQSKRVQNAMNDLNVNLETMQDQFMQGFDLLKTPLGEGPGEEPPAPLNTDYTQPGPTTGRQGGIETISKIIAKAETGGRYTAYAGDRGRGDQAITTMTLTQLRQKYGDYNTAVGAYQFMPGTAIGLAKQLGMDPNKTVFTPEIQDRLNQYHLKTMGYEQFKSGKLSQAEFGTRIAQQYRALPDPRTGRTYADQYASSNRATISLNEFNVALKESKENTSIPQISQPPSEKGGKVIEYLTGDRTHKRYRADHGAGNYHDHVAFDSQATRDAAIKWLRGKGWVVGSINTGRHAEGSFHYSNQAFDIPFYPNQSKKGVTDDAKGETILSSRFRADLIAGGFGGPQLGGSSIAPSPPAPAKVSPKNQPGQNVPSVSQNRRGQQILVVDDRQPPIPQQVSAGSGRSQPQPIPAEDSLNSLIKNQILLELAYT
jgi:hypothetical protein